MKRDYEELITVKDYVESLRSTGYVESESQMITASDYAKSLQDSTALRATSPLITVREYINALDNVKNSRATDKEVEAKIEAYLQKGSKAETAAQKLERLLA